MPSVGRKPKSELERRNRHQPVNDWLEVLNLPYDGPVPDPGRLPARTRRWWAVVSVMPHCVLWEPSDWLFALETAQVHAAWVRTGQATLGSEMRRREGMLGLTWEQRRDLRIRYVDGVEEEEAPTPVSIADRRREMQ